MATNPEIEASIIKVAGNYALKLSELQLNVRLKSGKEGSFSESYFENFTHCYDELYRIVQPDK